MLSGKKEIRPGLIMIIYKVPELIKSPFFKLPEIGNKGLPSPCYSVKIMQKKSLVIANL